jgi:hypothetical protein
VLTLALLPFHAEVPPLLNEAKNLIWVKERVMKGENEDMMKRNPLI